MGAEEGRPFESYEEDASSTDSRVWEETEQSVGDAGTPRVPDDVPEADALDQARPVLLEDDRTR